MTNQFDHLTCEVCGEIFLEETLKLDLVRVFARCEKCQEEIAKKNETQWERRTNYGFGCGGLDNWE